jgi:hypothetical protein
MTQAEKNTVCAPAHRPAEAGSKGGRKKLTFTIYYNERHKITAIDLDCHESCDETCPVRKVCDHLTAIIFKAVEKR